MNEDVVLDPIPLDNVLFMIVLEEMLPPELPGMYLLEPPCSFAVFRNVVELLPLLISC